MAKKPVANTEIVEETVNTEVIEEVVALQEMQETADEFVPDHGPYNLSFGVIHLRNFIKGPNQ